MPDRRGFTLVELILVMSILVVLTTIALHNVRQASTLAYLATMQSDLRHLAAAQEEHYSETEGVYASSVAALEFSPSPDVEIELQVADHGWTARASHRKRRPAEVFCAIYYGEVEPYFPASKEAVPSCKPYS